MNTKGLFKAVFLDRDGVINIKKEDGYVLDYSEFFFRAAAKEAIKILNQAQRKVIVITNQSVIGRGYITEDKLKDIHNKMIKELNEYPAYIDAIYYCKHHPDAGCSCRKPKPGLIIQAAEEHNIDLQNSWMIGDEDKDIEAGKAAGCRTIKLDKNITLLHAVLEILKNS